MKIKIIDRNKKDEKVYGVQILTSLYDFRIGLVPLGHPKYYNQMVRTIKETAYWFLRRKFYKHFRILWFAVGWQKLGFSPYD